MEHRGSNQIPSPTVPVTPPIRYGVKDSSSSTESLSASSMPSLTMTPSSADSWHIQTPKPRRPVQASTYKKRLESMPFNMEDEKAIPMFVEDKEGMPSDVEEVEVIQMLSKDQEYIPSHIEDAQYSYGFFRDPLDQTTTLLEVGKSGHRAGHEKERPVTPTPLNRFSSLRKQAADSEPKSTTEGDSYERVNKTPLLSRLTHGPATSRNADVSSWVFQDEDSNSSSDIGSVNSLESESQGDDFEGEERVPRELKTEAHFLLSGRQAALGELMSWARGALGHTSGKIAVASLIALQNLFERQMVIWSHGTDAGSPQSSGHFRAEINSQHRSLNTRGLKRLPDDDDEEFPNRDDGNPNKKRKLEGGESTANRRMWAYPYYKREPHRYCVDTELGDFRKCAKSPGFIEVHRVKDHVYKCHCPKYCDRCYAVFKNEGELTTHRRKSPACEIKPPQQIEGLTSDQKALLKPRDRNNSPEERWRAIYKICFPDDEIIPDPYYVHYSREMAELRQDIMAIIESETRIPELFDVNRMRQRVQQAFDTPRWTSSHSFTPLGLGIPTPSTSNTSGGRSSEAATRGIYERTPSVQRSSRTFASAIDPSNTLQIPTGITSDDQPDPIAVGDEGSSVPHEALSFDETNHIAGLDQPQSVAAIPFQGFTTASQRLDFASDELGDQFPPGLDLSDSELNELFGDPTSYPRLLNFDSG